MRLLRPISVILLVTSMVLLAACGGSGSTALTKRQFVKEASAICERQNEVQLSSVAAAQKQGESEAEMIRLALGPVRKQAEEIGALVPPAIDQGKIDVIVKELEGGSKKVAEDPSTLESSFAKVNNLILAYGLEGCTAP